MDGASLSWENGEIVLWVYDGVAQGGEVLCGGRRLTLTLSRNGDAETMLTLAALDGDGNRAGSAPTAATAESNCRRIGMRRSSGSRCRLRRN